MTSVLTDQADRLRALRDHDSTLMVEAGAGTGKTSLIAGRIVLLLASGVSPDNVAAITYTELAASELMQRVREYATDLVRGNIPEPLHLALPNGLSKVQLMNLETAVNQFDQLTCTTIHGFCQRLITPYPLEAQVDPGVSPMDEPEASLLAQTALRRWLRTALDNPSTLEDPIAEFLLQVPERAETLITSLVLAQLKYRNAEIAPAMPLGPHLKELLSAVNNFSFWYAAVEVGGVVEESTAEIIRCLSQFLPHYPVNLEPPSFQTLWSFAHPPTIKCMKKNRLDFRPYQSKGKWKVACKTARRNAVEADRFNDEAKDLYGRVDIALRNLVASVAGHLTNLVFNAVIPFKDIYQNKKRKSAALDFDDLLYFARTLLRNHTEVRKALAEKYRFILVDEFQDTDPVQCEILFLLCSQGESKSSWDKFHLRPGQLFLVGDPKQSIYRFRGADIHCYTRAREAINHQFPKNVLQITANFRSRLQILDFVNDRFGQAFADLGYEPLTCNVTADGEQFGVAQLPIGKAQSEYSAEDRREQEAQEVANLCLQLIGSYQVRRTTGRAPCRPGDIALLTPAGTGLWVYERALETSDIPIATQAGKGFFIRQEVHDMLAIARVLSNNRDTLALGALLRGPLIGLTEQRLLDIVGSLPVADYKTARLVLWTDPSQVHDSLASNTLRILQSLSRRAYNTSPFDVLSAAAEQLRVRPVLAQRHPRYFDRAISNVERFLEMSKVYAARGMRAFAEDMMRLWEEEERELEGRGDVSHEAVHVITIHSAKGLEWPVIVPINMATEMRAVQGVIYNPIHDVLHCAIGGLQPDSYVQAKEYEATEQIAERVRMRYVAATRARDLIVFPQHLGKLSKCWYTEMDLRIGQLPHFECESDAVGSATEPVTVNQQSAEVFLQEDREISRRTREVEWHHPSTHELGEPTDVQPPNEAAIDIEKFNIRGSAARGCVLHKLMEELLTKELIRDELAIQMRASTLLTQLGEQDYNNPGSGPSSQEIRDTVLRTVALPLVAKHFAQLLPEFRCYAASEEAGKFNGFAGTIDAVVLSQTQSAEFVFDWKSDVAPAAKIQEEHAAQVQAYLNVMDIPRGAVVYMTSGQIREVVR